MLQICLPTILSVRRRVNLALVVVQQFWCRLQSASDVINLHHHHRGLLLA
jgi:hypothetical protein